MTFPRVALVLVTLLYPLAVYFGLHYFDARSLALLLVVAAGLRLFANKTVPLNHWFWLPLVGVLVLWILVSNTTTGLKVYPVLMNLSFLTMFAWSLKHPPTVVERMARLQYGELLPQARRYTTTVTKVWCGFFIINGAISLATSLWATDEVWALYNGLIAYLLLGTLFGIEWLIRQRVMRLASE
ncbi:MAG: hypothetical protein WDZ30_06075 [Cellvibrionaceae bacterium]